MGTPTKPRILIDEPIYGPPMVLGPLTHDGSHQPRGRRGGAVWRDGKRPGLCHNAGIKAISRIARQCARWKKERWQRVRIEFEYEQNFLAHMHPADKCDLIICWSHNWQECPLEVVELKSAVTRIG